MDSILESLGLIRLITTFRSEKITPDIICDLSMYEMNYLGVQNRADVMKLRTACVHFGSVQPPRVRSVSGPSVYEISKQTLESLIKSGFTVKEMSDLLSVSESTIFRRMRAYGLKKHKFTEIDDERLDEVVNDIVKEFPKCGEKMLRELLRQRNINVPRLRLRDVLHLHHNNGIRDRTTRRLRRRVYHVQGPNHIWHVDTNHKLIRWYFVIAAGVDGFSRMIMFIQALDNNRSDTLLHVFQQAVDKFGTPLRVRTDLGMENVKIADFMLQQRGNGSVITGKSVHNQRIERLWRDVYDGVLGFYSELFSFMEDEGILDIMNPLHIFALHYVYIQKINNKLQIWCEAWSTHRLRTVRTSPLKLWTAGVVNNPVPVPDSTSVDSTTTETGEFGNNSTDSRRLFGRTEVHVSDRCIQHLAQQCPQNWVSANYGIEIYEKAVSVLEGSDDELYIII